MGDSADRALGHEVEHALGLGVEAVHVRLEQHLAGARGEVEQRHRGTGVGREGLLAQHMFARLEAAMAASRAWPVWTVEM